MKQKINFSLNRYIENELKLAIKFSKIILIHGPLGCGKTTLLKKIKPDFNYCNLETTSNKGMIDLHPFVFFNNLKFPVILDNFDSPDLLTVIYEERTRLKEGNLVIITNKEIDFKLNDFIKLMNKSISVFELNYLSRNEKQGIIDKLSFDLNNLKLPAVNHNSDNIYELSSRILKYGEEISPKKLYKYIKEESIKSGFTNDEISFTDKILYELATCIGNTININAISKNTGCNKKIIKDHIRLLTRLKIIHFLEPYNAENLKYITKSERLLFYNFKFLTNILGIKTTEGLLSNNFGGNIIKAFIVNQIMNCFKNQNFNFKYNYLENSNGIEVDLLVDQYSHLNLFKIQLKTVNTKEINNTLNLFDKAGLKLKNSFIISYDTDKSFTNEIFEIIQPVMMDI